MLLSREYGCQESAEENNGELQWRRRGAGCGSVRKPVFVHTMGPVEFGNRLVRIAHGTVEPESHARPVVGDHLPRVVPHLGAEV